MELYFLTRRVFSTAFYTLNSLEFSRVLSSLTAPIYFALAVGQVLPEAGGDQVGPVGDYSPSHPSWEDISAFHLITPGQLSDCKRRKEKGRGKGEQ